jgi:predicted alpha/beta superfamily hydrolase
VRLENFNSAWVSPRHIDIWIPDHQPEDTLAVLYMHDGQMLFDSTTTWNNQSWDIDDILTRIHLQSPGKKIMVVGVLNSGKTRYPEYFPQKPFEMLGENDRDYVVNLARQFSDMPDIDGPWSDKYLKFLTSELKPYIDRHFNVYRDRKHTFTGGSSMGGLISLYALCEYPEIYGGAMCMSTHWPGIFDQKYNPVPAAFFSYLEKHLPNPETHLIYSDCGNQGLDASYPVLQNQFENILKSKGYSEKNALNIFYPGQEHSEKAWKSRLATPLEFFIKSLSGM